VGWKALSQGSIKVRGLACFIGDNSVFKKVILMYGKPAMTCFKYQVYRHNLHPFGREH
jgi:hypothetical protein